MTPGVDAASLASPARPAPAARSTGAAPAALRRLRRALLDLGRPFFSRAPSAHGLTDRQLADIGLSRADLPDYRGWRR